MATSKQHRTLNDDFHLRQHKSYVIPAFLITLLANHLSCRIGDLGDEEVEVSARIT